MEVSPLIEDSGCTTAVSCLPPDDNANNLTVCEDDNDNMNEAASEDSGLSSVLGVDSCGGNDGVGSATAREGLSAAAVGHHNNHHHHHGGGLLVMPTSPISVTTVSMSASDDMIENENEMLRDRVADLEKRVHDQNDEITCLRATLADCLRRINSLETNKGHVQVSNSLQQRLRRDTTDNSGLGCSPLQKTPQGRRPISGSYSSQDFNASMARAAHEAVNRRASYASNRDRGLMAPGLYQSTSSLHNNNNDGQSSTSMSPAPSPSPTTQHGPPMRRMSPGGQRLGTPQRPSSAAMAGSSGLHKRWSSTSDFRELSPAPGAAAGQSATLNRRGVNPGGSLASLRSPFGSQQNLNRQVARHGTKEAQFSQEEGILRFYLGGRLVSLACPSPQLDSYSLARVSPAPLQRLRLEWVYGYRGRDARANLQLLPTGEMVYFIAAVVVLYNVEEQNQRHYLGHTQDIKCMSVHPNRLLIATGQAGGSGGGLDRPHIRVWNSVSLQTLHTLGAGDFERAICCLSFSKADGGNLLVAVDEVEHNISVWDWQRSDKGHKITETKCSTETVVAAEFHPLDGTTIVTVGKGFVNFWQLDPTTLTLSRKTGIFDQRDKPKYVTCLAFSYTGDVITGDSNGNVFIWGRGYNAVTKVMRKIHDGPIFSICVLKDGSVITGGGKDSRIVKFDTLYRKIGVEAQLPEHLGSIRIISQGRGSQLLLGTTRNSILSGNFDLNFQEIMVGHTAEVWALATSPSSPQFISAGHDRLFANTLHQFFSQYR
jgi:microtubule-associated protein-like 1/2